MLIAWAAARPTCANDRTGVNAIAPTMVFFMTVPQSLECVDPKLTATHVSDVRFTARLLRRPVNATLAVRSNSDGRTAIARTR
jgi:hypothetical protein